MLGDQLFCGYVQVSERVVGVHRLRRGGVGDKPDVYQDRYIVTVRVAVHEGARCEKTFPACSGEELPAVLVEANQFDSVESCGSIVRL